MKSSDATETDISRPETGQHRSTWVRGLGRIVDHAQRDDAIRKSQLGCGDRIQVRTRNSLYTLWSLGGDQFIVRGGWFDLRQLSPATLTVNGCTYGGAIIRHDIVAARGLFLEFGNGILTTRIEDVKIERYDPSPDVDPFN